MGFGIKKEAGSNSVPSQIVNFDKLTPTTAGVVFTPNTPATLDTLYLSSVNASTWIWNGTAYVTYSAPATATTEWYLLGTTIDAGSNKTAPISRNNSIYTQGYDSYFNGVKIGLGLGNIATNTSVGNNAGASNTTGDANSFFGYESGYSNTIGRANTSIGYKLFFFNTTGSYNTAIGANTLYYNTIGVCNTAIGVSAGITNTTGNYNVFLGLNSGYNNTTASFNTFIGSYSGTNNTTAQYNTFVGYASGTSNTIGSSNSFFGNDSGYSNTSGVINTFVGDKSGYYNTIGNASTYVGSNAGFNNTTGSNNTFIGTNSGMYLADGVTPMTIAVNSSFLGTNTKSFANNQTNEIAIGFSAIGKGTNTVNIGNTSITNTYLNGAVTFNNAFTFPTTDGTANYFLKTNGSGTVTWGVAGLSYFAEAQATTGVNATVYANSLSAVSTTASADFIIIPKGNGSIINRVPDGTATGGNKRGIKCLDLQTSITSAARVAGGTGNTILSGIDNYITSPATYSVITGGTNNAITNGTSSLIVGDSCNITGSYSLAVGGCNVSGSASASIGLSAVSGGYSLAVGGYGTVSGTFCFATGRNYLIDGFYSAGFGLGAKNYGHSSRIVNGTFSASAGATQNQGSWFQLAADTSNATATLLYAYNGLNTSSIDLQNNNLMRIKGMIIGKQVSSVNSAIFDIDVTVVRGATAGTVAILGTPSISLVVNTGGFGTPTITTSSSGIDFKVIGLLATTIKWSCRLDTVEVIA